ncbi:MAG: hypothetical protein IRZ33_11270 [Alicyclobacillaceae bacterium]|nr:hypothetical protein [Alicyclobacillaceae bacterium]
MADDVTHSGGSQHTQADDEDELEQLLAASRASVMNHLLTLPDAGVGSGCGGLDSIDRRPFRPGSSRRGAGPKEPFQAHPAGW